MVQIFTDGAAKGNPGPGGYGVILRYKGHEKELSAGYRLTTNNRMELMAVIVALESLKKENLNIIIYSDSKYVIDAIDKGWIYGWMKKGFAKKKNPDLWMRLMQNYAKHTIKFVWVKGHYGHAENERCDALAVAAYGEKKLLIDEVYEKSDKKLFE